MLYLVLTGIKTAYVTLYFTIFECSRAKHPAEPPTEGLRYILTYSYGMLSPFARTII